MDGNEMPEKPIIDEPEHWVAMDRSVAPEPVVDEEAFVAAGGWCAPDETIYDVPPEIAVTRGGIRFTTPKPMSKKQLREALRLAHKTLDKEYRKNRKLKRRVRRLMHLIEKGL